jgi:hypothetical protein
MWAVHSLTKVASSAVGSSRIVPSAAGTRLSDIRRHKAIIPGRGIEFLPLVAGFGRSWRRPRSQPAWVPQARAQFICGGAPYFFEYLIFWGTTDESANR